MEGLLDEEVWDGVVGVDLGLGVAVHVLQVVGVVVAEGGVGHVGEEGGLDGGAWAGAGVWEVEARAGCLEWRRRGSPGTPPVATVSGQ